MLPYNKIENAYKTASHHHRCKVRAFEPERPQTCTTTALTQTAHDHCPNTYQQQTCIAKHQKHGCNIKWKTNWPKAVLWPKVHNPVVRPCCGERGDTDNDNITKVSSPYSHPCWRTERALEHVYENSNINILLSHKHTHTLSGVYHQTELQSLWKLF